MIRKVADLEDAKKLMDEIWQMKSFANAIEMKLMRREYNNEAQAADAGTN